MFLMSLEEEISSMVFSGNKIISDLVTDKAIITSGNFTLQGNLECNGFRSSGSMHGKGTIITHKNFASSGTLKFEGEIECDENAKFSGSANISGNIIIKRTFICSGALNLLGNLKVGLEALCSGLTKCDNLLVNGLLSISGRLEALEVEAGDGIKSSGTLSVMKDIDSSKFVDITGKLNVGGNIYGDTVLIDYGRKERILKFIKFNYIVNGNIHAKNLVSIDRTLVEGDIRGRSIIIEKNSQVKGNIYYVDDYIIHDKAKITKPPIQIKLEAL
jgi:cytoskeletal protein CcmA (bactofilin family)